MFQQWCIQYLLAGKSDSQMDGKLVAVHTGDFDSMEVVGETVDREPTTKVGADDPSAMFLRGGADSSSDIMIGLFLDAVSKQGKQDEHFQSLGWFRDWLLFSEVHFL